MSSLLKKINKKNKVLMVEDLENYKNEIYEIKDFIKKETKSKNPDYSMIASKMNRLMKIERILKKAKNQIKESGN